jgi:2-succinyl-6-hydroxy-2,4-cyclohexadiene-1-carboxylate synthase
MIHVFHGFLGSPEDFDFLRSENVQLHDLYNLGEVKISPQDTLIGYSMGGRVALELAERIDYKFKKLVLINAHPGLPSSEEKEARRTWEDSLLEKLQTLPAHEFITFWNELPIFIHDRPLSPLTEERYSQSKTLFDKHRLSNQKNYLPSLAKNREKVLFVVGLFDEKYMELVSESILPHDILVKGLPGGHRLFQNQEELKALLVNEGIL